MSKILIYGGSFNPVHLGHVSIVKEAMKLYDFDKILIIPNAAGFFKDNTDVASIKHRLKMLQLAFKDIDNVSILDIEINQKEAVYTYNTIELLKDLYRGDFYYLIGSDQALQLDKWYRINDLKQEVNFIVAARDEDDIKDSDLIVLNNQRLPYSSTNIREYYAKTGIKEIDAYIRKYGLYLRSVLKHFLADKRYQHTLNVASLAKETAKLHKLNKNKAYIAAMLHDIAKELPLARQVHLALECPHTFELAIPTYHAYASASIAKELGFHDQKILDAIKYHTTAYYKMSKLSKLIYTCDFASEERDFHGIDKIRHELKTDLNKAFKDSFLMSYEYLIKKDIHISNELEDLKNKIIKGEV